MNIYFTASARASKEQKENHELIYQTILNLGHVHIDNYKKNANAARFYSANEEEKTTVYQQALEFVKNADLVILEVSTHSLTMGYLIKHAIDVHTPVIALHTENHSPGFILGIDSDSFQLIEYDTENIATKLKKAINYITSLEDVRFNLMLPAKIAIYLNETAEKLGVSKAHFVRNLIVEHEKNHND